MADELLFELCLLTFVLSITLATGVAGLSYWLIWRRSPYRDGLRFFDTIVRMVARRDKRYYRSALLAAAQDLADYRERRNELWTAFGQIMLSLFIVTVLTVLLLAKIIEPDAGLPILSGISGFAIAKTVSASKNRPNSRPRNHPDSEPKDLPDNEG